MKAMFRLGWKVLTVVTCFGSVGLAQMQQSGLGGSTSLSSGFAGGTSGSSGRNASQAAQGSGLQSARLGTSSTNAGGVGTGLRIDRTSATNADNPRNVRGSSVLGGDAGMQGQAGAGRTGGQTGITGSFGGAGGGGRNTSANQRRQNQNKAQYATHLAFASAPAFGGSSSAANPGPIVDLQEVLTSLPQSSVHLATEEGVVVLRGTVASESDRNVAERMAKMQPGVDRVKNELEIAPVAEQP